MQSLNRREAVTAAGVIVGTTMLGSAASAAKPAEKPSAEPIAEMLAKDSGLKAALKSTAGWMFAEQTTFKTSVTEPHSFSLWITSARDPVYGGERVVVRPGTMRIFRAEKDVDDFTKKGGVYWECGATKGSFQFKQAGALIMIVRDQDGTVHCYSLAPDLRC